ncbi:HCCA isomerase/glutathione S-transferase kappa [Penicillium cf. griseofulvum]|uniref:Glutathione S-transferase kappa n=1 Tax=Penicillium cf. griseofulvum TaxID=2972120 RepID=A0A9W9N0U3_9EURO|nr:HCCA isomerase/glutathione S-transferase kappa [Penicillium cf. griseofulvum]
MPGKIDAYVDCVSPYSYYATLYLRKNRKALESHGVEVEFHPVFLGGINGINPPWTLPAKAAYSKFDSERACKYFGVPQIQTPDFFPILSILPQRCMIYIKSHFPREKYEITFLSLWEWMFYKGIDISKPENLAELFQSHGYSDSEVKEIMTAASNPEFKQALTAITQTALDKGAYGAPWFWVRNAEGKEEPFFGSDRFAFMWMYLGLPFQDVSIVEKEKSRL